MEARWYYLIIAIGLVCPSNDALMAQGNYRTTTTNFTITSPDPNLARRAGQLAEQYRKALSLQWLGYEIATWQERCPVQIVLGPHAGGETSFAFVEGQKSEPIGWQMKIVGPADRVLDAVLPHEITHTIFATHFGQPLPRWADEGACTTVEHESERKKNHEMLMNFLTAKPSRGIPFNRMYTMKRYPHDILPLYAQGYSLAKFLIAQKGRIHFVSYIQQGLRQENQNLPGKPSRAWDTVTETFYGYQDLSDLQIAWIAWVRKGSPTDARSMDAFVSSANRQPATVSKPELSGKLGEAATSNLETLTSHSQNLEHSASWYAQKSQSSADAPTTPISPKKILLPSGAFQPGSTFATDAFEGRNNRTRRESIWR